MYDIESGIQYFPFRTVAMLASLSTCIGISLYSRYLFTSGKLSPEMDFLNCVVNIPAERIRLPTDTSFNISCETLALQKLNGSQNGATATQIPNIRNNHLDPGNGLLSETSALHPQCHSDMNYDTLQNTK